MSSSSEVQEDAHVPTSESNLEELAWSVLPARDRPLAAVAALVVVGFLGVSVGVIARDWIWGAIAVVILLATLSRFFLRSRIVISREGIRAEFPLRTRQLPWGAVAWVRYDDRAALVRSRRRSWFLGREVTLLFGSHGPAVVDAIERLVPAGLASRRDGGEARSCDA